MVDQISKLKEHMDLSVLKAIRRERKCYSNIDTDIMQMDIDSEHLYDQIACLSKIVFAHPEALLEDNKIFPHLKSKPYQDSVKAIVIDEAHLVEEW